MDARWADEQQEKKTGSKKASRLTSITGKLIFLRPLRGELGDDWNCMCFAGKGSAGSRCGRGCCPPKPNTVWVRYSDAAFGSSSSSSSSSGQGGDMTLVWIFWRAASRTSQGIVMVVVVVVVVVLLLWLAQSEQGFAAGRGQNGVCLGGCRASRV
ncbi:hypothetical protein COCMIDRAFT_26436 [Bipolaris oryzae ATCC 44560]|uniref:Uncharacterized protein n=1 Tax=Bipolaris oryzae ATCC 44560 TaxID=930090 RepID=W6Z6H9_COCMI|nr:uncharacterized protein COCMIDRAFT_26436 [Bipolaris oryzae ATCC 44560]EUC45413.1 hypothetical protein COCMIDRAFT_26436 [Bipolaris oryzae ATCC 44560]